MHLKRINEIKTLYDLHNEKIKYFNDENLKLDNLKSKYNEDNLNYLEKKTIEKKINEIDNHFYELEYYDSVKDILLNYFEKNNLSDNIKLKKKYISIVSPDKLIKKKKINMNNCSNCNIVRIYSEQDDCYICTNCGSIEYIMLSNIDQIKNEVNVDKVKFPYKKINHFIEKLNQYQSKEKVIIPNNIYDIIQNELKMQRITRDIISPVIIKNILKKNKLHLYYENIQYIYSKITNTKPPLLSKFLEKKMKEMFNQAHKSFLKYKPPNRNNFLNYDYIINKIFRILKRPDHAKNFPMLKSTEKLKIQDDIWQKICKDLNWTFHRSI